jgi:hypothetical protein
VTAPTSDQRCVAIVTACAEKTDDEIKVLAAEFRPDDVVRLATVAAGIALHVAHDLDMQLVDVLNLTMDPGHGS